MVQKVNIKARIDRHSRMMKDSFWTKNKIVSLLHNRKFGYNIVIVSVVFLLPIYPLFASLVHNNSEYDFYRWYIDEGSILGSYYSDVENQLEWENLYEAKDSFFSVNTILDDSRDLSGTNEIVEYKVESWDSFSTIAHKFQVTSNSIYWANNFSSNHIIHPWDLIKIPPVSGVIHEVKKWETLSIIAKKYSIDVEEISKQNLLAEWEWVKVWDELVIPWAIKQIERPKYIAPTKTTTSTSGWYSFANSAESEFVNAGWSYKLTSKPSYHTFYWWNCTWYVAKYKTVNWWGNAKDWLKNASAKGRATWSTPELWSIVVFNGRWYNPRYGHVWIVMDIKSDHIIVSDMNYRRLNEVTYRKVPINDRAIMGYIYGE